MNIGTYKTLNQFAREAPLDREFAPAFAGAAARAIQGGINELVDYTSSSYSRRELVCDLQDLESSLVEYRKRMAGMVRENTLAAQEKLTALSAGLAGPETKPTSEGERVYEAERARLAELNPKDGTNTFLRQLQATLPGFAAAMSAGVHAAPVKEVLEGLLELKSRASQIQMVDPAPLEVTADRGFQDFHKVKGGLFFPRERMVYVGHWHESRSLGQLPGLPSRLIIPETYQESR